MRTQHSAFSLPGSLRLTPLAAAFAVALSPAAMAGIFVTTTAPTGPGSLGQAISDANASCGSNPVIDFQLVGAGPFVIKPSSPLPTIYCGTIDGYSQAGASVNTSATGFNAATKVTLDGSLQSYGCGLSAATAGYGPVLVKGLTIQGFDSGVCGTADLRGNVIKNNVYGADMYQSSAVIGTSATADRNVFTGNTTAGIWLSGGSANVVNNFIGTQNGSSAAANGKGVYIQGAGGTLSGNVISGNSDVGVYVYGDYGGSAIVENFIGLNAAGTTKLANGGGGIFATQLQGLSIADNHISGNSVSGIGFQNASGLYISGNTIGLSTSGTAVPNTRGIESFCGGYVSISNNVVQSNQFEGIFLNGGDPATIEENTIANNGSSGVRLELGSCGYGGDHYLTDNVITGNKLDGVVVTGGSFGNELHANQIYGNTRKSINLSSPSTTPLPNDVGDGDGGNNNQQNYPVIQQALQDAGANNTYITFTLDSVDSTSFNVEFFSNPTPGDPGGQVYLGQTTVYVYGGVYSGSFTAYGQLADNISATATSTTTWDTSEYSPQKAAIAAPAATVSPSTVNFGEVLVNTESAERTITIRSVGDVPYEIDEFDGSGSCYGGGQDMMSALSAAPLLCSSGAFICETTCETETPYNKGQSCRITAKFAPTYSGSYSSSIYICDNTSASPKQILLQGEAVLPPPITITPKSWDFGTVPVGEGGEPKKFVVSNIGYGGLNLVSLTTTGEFDIVGTTCSGYLYGGSSCDVVANFFPTVPGESTGSLVATYNDMYGGSFSGDLAGAPFGTTYKTASLLSGIGAGGGELTLPGPIELGAAVVGGNPVSKTVELKNTGTQPVTISSITLSGPFTMVNNCTAPLAPGASCTVTISFTAPAVGEFNGSFTVVSDASGGSGEISVHATGQVIAAPLLQITPTSIGFGDRVIGSQSAGQNVTITNVGGVAATISLTTSSVDFLIAGNSCGTTLAPQASCSALLAFRPLLGFGPRSGTLIVTSNASNSPQGVALGGTGCRPYIGVGNRTGTSENCAP